MKFRLLLVFLFLMPAVGLFAQGVALNNVGAAADTTSMLDIKSTTKGLLVPRMSQANRLAILNPAIGLMVYQTDFTAGFYFNQGPGTSWTYINPTGSSTTGFSAIASAFATATSAQLTGWTVTDPYYTGTGFNPVTGNYTVPETGSYAISATVNYNLTSTVTTSTGAGVNPVFQINRTVPSTTTLLTGAFPIFDVNIALVLTLRTPLRTATVTMTGNVNLNAGDVIGLFYNANGFTQSLDMGTGTVWSVKKL